ncbi:hypothetical protein [Streptomyces malaysiensis]|uniref:STAS domain-containing protein n=1 Tax=Streptomyces malaysiensis TaxID=92644 RepID=A0A2J7Z4W4_STRMQ|nr:hypothetical protein [Streptomyces malaysiensis]PNG95314.1 hypothetical protein SMF913_11339 [Streptomyces malaysiensis]
MDESLGIRRDGPGQRPHPAAGGTSGGTMWLLRPDGGLDRPDHPLFMDARRVGRERPGAAVIVDLSQVREITADDVRGRCSETRTNPPWARLPGRRPR